MPDHETRGVKVHLVVCQHEADTFMTSERLAKGLPMRRIVFGYVMCTACLPQPSHAVSQTGRCQSNLRVAESPPYLAQYVGHRHAQILEPNHTVATGKAGVERVHCSLVNETWSICVTQEHGGAAVFHARHDDRVCGALRAGNEPF